MQDLVCVLETFTIIVFSRSGYKDLLGTPKRLLLRPSENVLIVSEGFCVSKNSFYLFICLCTFIVLLLGALNCFVT